MHNHRRPILASISQRALQHNLTVVKKHAPNAKVMAVVKANGYGHGLMNVAHALSAADGYAVLGINEAIDLREAGFEHTMLLLEGVFNIAELAVAASFSLDIVVHCQQQVDMLVQTKLKRPVNVHLKMNSGMNRLGFKPAAFIRAYQALSPSKNVKSIVLMTHFATADDSRGISKPWNVFQQGISSLNGSNATSLANSATILRHPEAHADWVRPGIMLYGASPIASVAAAEFDLQPAMTLSSEIIAVQTLQAGDSAGYGHLFTAEKTTRLGIVACGYADGYPRHALNNTPIAVAGKLTQTLGRVSMDMLFVDITDVPQANIGAPVELWGSQVPVDIVAQAAGTIGYELLCAVSARVPTKVVD